MEEAGLSVRVRHPSIECRNQKRDTLEDKAAVTEVRAGTVINPNSLVQLVMLANLFQQLILAVAKQTEGQVVVDAKD